MEFDLSQDDDCTRLRQLLDYSYSLEAAGQGEDTHYYVCPVQDTQHSKLPRERWIHVRDNATTLVEYIKLPSALLSFCRLRAVEQQLWQQYVDD